MPVDPIDPIDPMGAPWSDLLFPIKIGLAATLLDLHQQTLRAYEQQKVLVPSRTPKGTRLYTRDDLVALVRIKRLSVHGVSLAGIRIILGIDPEPPAPAPAPAPSPIPIPVA